MLKKQYVKSRKVAKVRFELPKKELPKGVEVKTVHLVGEFNGWDITANPMKPNSKNVYNTTLELAPGRTYQFRYLVNGEHWCNDWQADGYARNASGTDNCVVVTPSGA